MSFNSWVLPAPLPPASTQRSPGRMLQPTSRRIDPLVPDQTHTSQLDFNVQCAGVLVSIHTFQLFA